MAYLEEYKSIDEKAESFDGEVGMLCGDVNLLFKKLEELLHSGKFLFRGMNNAKHKLYNSAQREFLKRELLAIDNFSSAEEKYNEWIKELIKDVKNWNSNSIEKFFNSIGISNNEDIAYLSFMQHYGFPTPMLDFTTNPYVALFFAIDKVKYSASHFNIDSCVSLYYINKQAELHKTFNVDDYDTGRNINVVSYDDFIKNNGIAFIEHTSTRFRVRNSMNLINQEGCFIFNWHAVNPLEVAYKQMLDQLNNGFLNGMGHEIKGEKMTCLNIHKSIIPKIRHELDKRKGINSNFIYPDFNNHKDSIIDKSISNLLS